MDALDTSITALIDPNIVSAFITGAFGVICAIMGQYHGRRNASTISKRQLWEAQITNVLAPMDKALSFSPSQSALTTFDVLGKIIDNNYKDVPIAILEEYQELRKVSNIKPQDLTKMTAIVSSYYNWLKRSLGYPHDNRKIVPEFTPVSRRTILLHIIVNGLLLLLYALASMVVLVSVNQLIRGENQTLPDWLVESSMFVFSCGIFGVLFSRFQNK